MPPPGARHHRCLQEHLDPEADLVFVEYTVNDRCVDRASRVLQARFSPALQLRAPQLCTPAPPPAPLQNRHTRRPPRPSCSGNPDEAAAWKLPGARLNFERLLRKLLQAPGAPAVVLVHLPTRGQAFPEGKTEVGANTTRRRGFHESVEDGYGALSGGWQPFVWVWLFWGQVSRRLGRAQAREEGDGGEGRPEEGAGPPVGALWGPPPGCGLSRGTAAHPPSTPPQPTTTCRQCPCAMPCGA